MRTRRLRLTVPLVVSVAVVAVVAAGGCGGPAPDSGGPPGVVHGNIVLSGGPPGAEQDHAAGTVVVTSRGGGEIARQSVAEGQEFRFTLRPGRYRLRVSDLGDGCQSATVTVASGSDQAVPVVCSRK